MYGDYVNSSVTFGNQDDFEFMMKLGRGRYSEVFKAVNLLDNETVVVKILKPVKKEKIRREVKVLETLQGCPQIVQLVDIIADPSTKTPSIVMEYVPHIEFRTLYQDLSREEIKVLIYQTLLGLKFCHSRGIIHRDIKPGNVLMKRPNLDEPEGCIKIADWGLADFYTPSKRFNCRVASRYFKAPELLLNNHYYDY